MKNDIEALRGFANDIIDNSINADNLYIYDSACKFGLINEDESKTETLTGGKDDISLAQERLYFMWISDILKAKTEQFRGYTKKDLHWMFKEKYLVEIFKRDDSEFLRDYRVYEKHMMYASFEDAPIIKKMFLGMLSITDATKYQATEYLKDIESFCWDNGIQLRTDMALYSLAVANNLGN